MAARVRKAVFPVAGLGTRFLPATKAMPKEMLTVVDRPVIQYVVDEAREAGIEHFIFVTGRNKGVIEDHFDTPVRARGDARASAARRPSPRRARPRPAGRRTRRASPASRSRSASAMRSGARASSSATSRSRVLLPDMLMHGRRPGCLAQMIDAYARNRRQRHRGRGMRPEDQAQQLRHRRRAAKGDGRRLPHRRHGREAASRDGAVESLHHRPLHPAAGDLRPSRRAGARRRRRDPAHRRDDRAAQDASPSTRCRFEGRTFDCGSKVGFLTANVAYALDRPDIAEAFKAEIKKLL